MTKVAKNKNADQRRRYVDLLVKVQVFVNKRSKCLCGRLRALIDKQTFVIDVDVQ